MNLRPRPASRFLRPDLLPGNATMRVVLVLSITAIVALATVVNMMQGDYTNLFIGLAAAGIALYIGGLWRFSWFAAVLIGMMGFTIAPSSFWIPADFMCCGFALGMGVTVLIRRALGSPSPDLSHEPNLSLRALIFLQVLYLAYLFLQGMFGEIEPVYVGQYSLRNTIKAYAEDATPGLTLLILTILRYRLPSMAALTKGVSLAMILALVLLICYRAYQIAKGHYEADETTDTVAILIPVINLIPGEFALRVASPIAAMWAASRLFSPAERISKRVWLTNGFLLFLAIAGSILSSGRATPALALLGVCSMAFVMRRSGLLMAGVAGFVLFVVAVNLAGSSIDQLPYAIRRSLATLRFDENSDKYAIEGSTTMRQFLIDEGMKELKSNGRIMATGRGVLQFTAGDSRINESDQEYDKWMLAVRTGRLHQTSMNQVIRYGVVGAGLYYLCQLAILLYTYKAFQMFRRRNQPEVAVAAFSLGLMVMNLGLSFLQDAPFTNLQAWLVALVVGLAVKQEIPLAARDAATVPRGQPMGMPAGLAGRQR